MYPTRVLVLTLLLLGSVSVTTSIAQISVKAVPYSLRTSQSGAVPTHTLDPVQAPMPRVEFLPDSQGFFDVPPAPMGAAVAVDLGFDNAGQWHVLPDGGRLWQLRITSEQARSIQLEYDDFWMPPGAQLFLYNEDRSIIRGAFTAQNNKPHGGFATDAVPGATTILEYYEPAGVTRPGRLHIATATHGTRQGDTQQTASINGPYSPIALSCSINVACPAGSGWENEINAVVHISNGCTGVLLNNTREDGKPYVLTANHCGSPTVGQTVNWVFYFNYQSATCSNPAQTPVAQTLSGAIVRAANSSTADFTLLELLEPIPNEYNAYYAGWSIENTTPTSGMVIGHPRSDIKKITVENNSIGTINGNAWVAQFDQGTIEGGSSGSPLFNQNHQFIGHVRSALQMDPNACSGPGGDDNNAVIMFPKLSSNWSLGSPGQRLSDFLDPDNTGTTNLPALPGGSGGGGSPPSAIWINEVNAFATATNQDDEFIEIVGPPGTNLNNYKVDIYSCAGGTATLQSTQTISNFTLQNDYGSFGVFLMAGPGTVPNRDHAFSGTGVDMLPDNRGILVLKDNTNTEIFSYQYDTQSGGLPTNCPATRTTRSAGDAAGSGTMGFTLSSNPSASALASSGLTASPGQQNWDGGQVLPVELVAFDALLDGSTAMLRWKTASETNNAGFEIQHAEANSLAWTSVGWIDGHGTTVEVRAYEHRIEGLTAGTHRFRLKQIDYDGTFDYSPEVEVAVNLPTAYHLASAYPNPFNPRTTFSLSVAQTQEVEIAVYNMLGQRVSLLHEGLMDANSSRSFQFEADDLPSGLYLIRAVGERFVASQKVTLVK